MTTSASGPLGEAVRLRAVRLTAVQIGGGHKREASEIITVYVMYIIMRNRTRSSLRPPFTSITQIIVTACMLTLHTTRPLATHTLYEYTTDSRGRAATAEMRGGPGRSGFRSPQPPPAPPKASGELKGVPRKEVGTSVNMTV